MYAYIRYYMQICISIGTDIHNTNMKMIVVFVGVFMFILVLM